MEGSLNALRAGVKCDLTPVILDPSYSLISLGL
jgi:hypothetical protein